MKLDELDITLVIILGMLFFIFLDTIIVFLSKIALVAAYVIVIALACWVVYTFVILSKSYYHKKINPILCNVPLQVFNDILSAV